MKKSYWFIVIGAILVLLAGGAIAWPDFLGGRFVGDNGPQVSSEPVFCTMEAKECPDGSYVGRIPPKCEFAPCPGLKNWKTTTENGISFKYPESLDKNYIDAFDWPPKVNVYNEQFACTKAGTETARAGKTELKTVNGREYCVTTLNEGAAGSIYSQYAYAMPRDNKTLILTFTLRYPQCMNYDDPKQTECKAEQSGFRLDDLLDRIAQTISAN